MKNYKYHKYGIAYFFRTVYLCNINYDKVGYSVKIKQKKMKEI